LKKHVPSKAFFGLKYLIAALGWLCWREASSLWRQISHASAQWKWFCWCYANSKRTMR